MTSRGHRREARSVGIAAIVAIALAACDGSSTSPVADPSGSEPARQPSTSTASPSTQLGLDGARIYQVACAGCHGTTGEGNLGPPLHGVATRLTIEQQIDVVTRGRGTMLAFSPGLTAEQIAAVVDYTRTDLP